MDMHLAHWLIYNEAGDAQAIVKSTLEKEAHS